MKQKKEILLEEYELIDFMERDLNQEDLRRVLLALEVAPKLRGRLNEYLLVRESLKNNQPMESEVDMSNLHSKIMMQIEAIEIEKYQTVKKK